MRFIDLHLSEDEFQEILIALENRYLKYNDGRDDEDVYNFNTKIDKVIRSLLCQAQINKIQDELKGVTNGV
jgi:hypothetical protein